MGECIEELDATVAIPSRITYPCAIADAALQPAIPATLLSTPILTMGKQLLAWRISFATRRPECETGDGSARRAHDAHARSRLPARHKMDNWPTMKNHIRDID